VNYATMPNPLSWYLMAFGFPTVDFGAILNSGPPALNGLPGSGGAPSTDQSRAAHNACVGAAVFKGVVHLGLDLISAVPVAGGAALAGRYALGLRGAASLAAGAPVWEHVAAIGFAGGLITTMQGASPGALGAASTALGVASIGAAFVAPGAGTLLAVLNAGFDGAQMAADIQACH
jgi:hypothetical protein